MPRIIVLIRHSNTQPDPNSVSKNWTLTEDGEANALKLSSRLTEYNITKIYASEEPKACATGEIIGHELGLSYEIAEGLHETRRETAPFYDSKDDFIQAVKVAMDSPDEILYGEEAFADALKRFETSLNTLIFNHPQENLAIVSHGTVMSLFISKILGMNTYSVWQCLGMPAYIAFKLPDWQLVEWVNS